MTSLQRYTRAAVSLVGAASAGALLGVVVDRAPLAGAAAAICIVLLAVVVATDLRERRIPNAWTYPTVLLGFGLALLAGLDVALLALAGALLAGGVLLLLAITSGGGIGIGDVKLGVAVGALVGPAGAVNFLLIGGVAGGVFALLWLLRGHGRREAMPYGPALAVGAVVALLATGPVVA